MNPFKKSNSRVCIAKTAAAAAAATLSLALALAPLAPFVQHSVLDSLGVRQAEAASYINTNVQSNTSLTSGLVLQYSFDNTKVSATSITDPRYAECFGEASESGNGKIEAIMNV